MGLIMSIGFDFNGFCCCGGYGVGKNDGVVGRGCLVVVVVVDGVIVDLDCGGIGDWGSVDDR